MRAASNLQDGRRGHHAEEWPPSAWAAEALGTALLVFDALSAIALTMAPTAPLRALPAEVRLLIIGVVVGGTVAVFAITTAGKRSGAHLNPAVSVYMALRGALSVRDAVAYSVAQLAGSVVGVLVARLCWRGPMLEVSDGLIQPGPGVDAGGVLLGETLSTVGLLLVLSWLVSKPRPRETPWVIGGLIAVLIVMTGATSGGSFNPARNFGPFVLGSDFDFFWIYMLAPCGGAVITAVALHLTGAWTPRTCKLCGPAFDEEPIRGEDPGGPFRQRVCREIELAGFSIYSQGPGGGVEVRMCPEEYGGGVLVSWAPHSAACVPLNERVTAVEKAMADALVVVMSELGFSASRLGESFAVRVADA
ncbi:MIP/aquaporin family protein [Pseudonocardia spinosispora]|uniref:MIP/aquaporin family protein n=1 Tax=Pseudonocardia spinosispora TaxID=103441 RepID=UPI0004242DA3|nr:aquaporin [Pseudonocardia spinosispora]